MTITMRLAKNGERIPAGAVSFRMEAQEGEDVYGHVFTMERTVWESLGEPELISVDVSAVTE